MNNSNRKEFSEIMLAMGEIYDKTLTKALVEMYFDDLSGFTIDQISGASKKHRLNQANGQFFPRPADIARNIDGQQQTSEDRATLAWMEVEQAIGRVGAYGTLNLEDKQALMAVKHMGSWQQLCHTDRDKLGFKRQEFIKNYQALENTPLEALPSSLAGIEDLHNQRLGDDNPADDLLKKLELREAKKLNNLNNGE